MSQLEQIGRLAIGQRGNPQDWPDIRNEFALPRPANTRLKAIQHGIDGLSPHKTAAQLGVPVQKV